MACSFVLNAEQFEQRRHFPQDYQWLQFRFMRVTASVPCTLTVPLESSKTQVKKNSMGCPGKSDPGLQYPVQRPEAKWVMLTSVQGEKKKKNSSVLKKMRGYTYAVICENVFP